MKEARLSSARQLFVRRWGEMAATWGVPRTMAEIHALLYLATKPLSTDDIMEELAVSRGSASTNIRQLVNWGLIHRVHQRNDRKEYFEAEKDVWQMFETIMRERRRREVQPIVETIERCITMIDEGGESSGAGKKEVEAYKKRFTDILEFCNVMNTLFNMMSRVGHAKLEPMVKMLEKYTG